MGLPVICIDRIGASELIQDNINGFVVPKRRPDEIANKVKILSSFAANRISMIEEAIMIHEIWNTNLIIRSVNRLLRYEERI